ncbi:hypothetical protein F4703DRAFT_1797445 [Phycomyces blakesleeanus]
MSPENPIPCTLRLITQFMHSITKYLDKIGSRTETSRRSSYPRSGEPMKKQPEKHLSIPPSSKELTNISWDQALREEHLLYHEPLIFYGQRFWMNSWVRQMRRYIELNDIKDEEVMKIIPKLLGGEALEWYNKQAEWVDPEQKIKVAKLPKLITGNQLKLLQICLGRNYNICQLFY